MGDRLKFSPFVLAISLGFACLASAQQASSVYRPTSRDPFVKYKPRTVEGLIKRAPTVVEPPALQERIEQYKARKLAAMQQQQPAPKPTSAFLLSELQVIGIFRTPRGYAAMVEATPIKLSYVVYPGELFFDGQLVAVEENRLIFRREKRWSDGRREWVVEMKPLRQPDAVTEALTASKAQAEKEPVKSDEGKEEKKSPSK
jgi:hypothetical protein